MHIKASQVTHVGKESATHKNLFRIVKPIYQGLVFPTLKFPLPKAGLITAGASSNNVLTTSFAEPENTPSDVPAGLGPDALHPHSCPGRVLCSGE